MRLISGFTSTLRSISFVPFGPGCGGREDVAERARIVVDRGDVRRPLDGVVVDPRREPEAVAVPGHGEQRAEAGVVRALHAGAPVIRDRVARRLDRLARPQQPFPLRLVGARAGDADREQDDRRVHDVAAVAPPVASDQAEDPAGGRASAHELEHDRRGDEGRERVREQARPRAPEAEREQRDAGHHGNGERDQERLPERAKRRLAPGHERPDSHQQQQR